MLRLALPLFALLVAALSGCISQSTNPASLPAGADLTGTVEKLLFGATTVVDAARIASEPSVKVAKDGTIFVAAPTGVIKYATRPQDALNQADKGIFQGAIWRSQDGGQSFDFRAGLGPLPIPYHTAQPGGGDSDIAIDGDGRVYVADQFGLFTESVQYSDDLGETWTAATTTASGPGPVDRQWMWPDPAQPGHVWMVYDGVNVGMMVSETTDGGATWTAKQVSATSASPGPIVAIPGLIGFSMFANNGIVFVHSHDDGATWEEAEVGKGHGEINDFFAQTVADAAGTLYVAWMEKNGSDSQVVYTYSKDLGETWSPNIVAFKQTGLGTFLWMVAGDKGRLGFSWYGAADPEKEWYEEAGILLDGDSAAPRATQARVSEEPARIGPPCQSGSTCMSGRELGDFQQCAVTPQGDLLVAYVHVLSAQDGGRVTFGKMSGGPKLYDTPPANWVV
jgi:BNR/Asp-box repeat protein